MDEVREIIAGGKVSEKKLNETKCIREENETKERPEAKKGEKD